MEEICAGLSPIQRLTAPAEVIDLSPVAPGGDLSCGIGIIPLAIDDLFHFVLFLSLFVSPLAPQRVWGEPPFSRQQRCWHRLNGCCRAFVALRTSVLADEDSGEFGPVVPTVDSAVCAPIDFFLADWCGLFVDDVAMSSNGGSTASLRRYSPLDTGNKPLNG